MVMIIVFLVGLILCLKTKDKIELKQNTYNLEYGDDIVKEISFYLKDANSTKNIKDYELVYDINKNTETGLIDTGEYVIKIKYKKQVAEVRIIIKDTVAPKFSKAEDVIELEKDNMDVDLTTYFKVEDLDNDIKLNIEGQYDLFKIGEYNLKIIASDSSNNHTCKDFILKVYEPVQTKSNDSTKTKEEIKYVNFSDVVNKYKDNNTKIGIDISLWQGDIDFKKLKEAGVEFVIIRVGYMKGTNGERVLDSKFKQNIENANKNKIPVGVYYFSYASSKKEAIKDAKWVLKQIKN